MKYYNKIRKYVIAGCVTLGCSISFNSCDFLDIDPYITDLFTLDTVFAQREYTQRYLNTCYSFIPDYGSYRANSGGNNVMPWTLISDEGLGGHKNYYMYLYQNNILTSENLPIASRWTYLYQGIRQANVFLSKVNQCQEATDMERAEWRGEALFVKAMLYFELMLGWGPVCIVPDEPVSFDTPLEQMLLERSTWDECSHYVAGLLEEAIRLLPPKLKDESETGKATRNAALAVLSRLTLYTASPLYNGDNREFADFKNDAGVPYLNPEFSMQKWAEAAAAAKRLVVEKPNDLYTVPKKSNTPTFPVPDAEQADYPNGVGGIDPYHSYQDVFNGVCALASTNPEVLFTRQSSDINNYLRYITPAVVNGWGCFFATQNLVDAYYMADGKTIQTASAEYPYGTSGYTENDITFSGERNSNGFTLLGGTHRMYANREMRFYATIMFNNSYLPSTSTPPNAIDRRDGKVAKFYADAKSGKEYALQQSSAYAEDYPMSGYLIRKYLHHEDSWLGDYSRRAPKYAILYRMAEVYLNYVEAMNELDGSYTIGDVTVSRDPAEMKRFFNLIRYRAGLPGITDADVADPSRMRELILRERQIEFAWEGRRYFDLRRTKNAMYYENQPVTGCDVSAKEAEPDKFHSVIRLRERDYLFRVFTQRQYLLPLPKTEVDKNLNLDQAPGY